MGIYIEGSQHITNTSIANNTNIYPREHCEGTCLALSFCCYSNMTETLITMHYPRRSMRVISPDRSYVYREVDPWMKQNLTSSSGLCFSVEVTNLQSIGSGTYSCEAASNNSTFRPQLMNIGVYFSYGKMFMKCNNLKTNFNRAANLFRNQLY